MVPLLRKQQKKNFNGRAIKIGGGEGVKGRAIKEKITFLEPFFPTLQRFNVH